MEYQILKMISMACRSEDCYFEDGLNLGELHQRTDETGPLADRFTAALQSALDAAPPENETLKAGSRWTTLAANCAAPLRNRASSMAFYLP